MYVIAVEFTINKEFVSQFRDRIVQQANDSLTNESECHQFDVCFDSSDQTKCFLYEKYTDEAAFEVHRNTDYFTSFAAAVEPWVASKDLKTWICD
jgi:quinol monooxygenase YgiN